MRLRPTQGKFREPSMFFPDQTRQHVLDAVSGCLKPVGKAIFIRSLVTGIMPGIQAVNLVAKSIVAGILICFYLHCVCYPVVLCFTLDLPKDSARYWCSINARSFSLRRYLRPVKEITSSNRGDRNNHTAFLRILGLQDLPDHTRVRFQWPSC